MRSSIKYSHVSKLIMKEDKGYVKRMAAKSERREKRTTAETVRKIKKNGELK